MWSRVPHPTKIGFHCTLISGKHYFHILYNLKESEAKKDKNKFERGFFATFIDSPSLSLINRLNAFVLNWNFYLTTMQKEFHLKQLFLADFMKEKPNFSHSSHQIYQWEEGDILQGEKKLNWLLTNIIF